MSIKDSGARQSFNSGAVRDTNSGKGRMDLLPPDALIEVARVFEEGAKKYVDRNWEKGIPVMRFLDSAFRHLLKLMAGQRDEPHAGQAVWNLLCYIQTLVWIERGELPRTLDDRPARMRPAPKVPATVRVPVSEGVERPRSIRCPATVQDGTCGRLAAYIMVADAYRCEARHLTIPERPPMLSLARPGS